MSNSVEEFIKRSLPNVSEEERSNLSKHLQNMGLSSVEDLVYVRDEDVVDHLKPFPQRRFLECCKNGMYEVVYRCNFKIAHTGTSTHIYSLAQKNTRTHERKHALTNV